MYLSLSLYIYIYSPEAEMLLGEMRYLQRLRHPTTKYADQKFGHLIFSI